MNDYSNNIITPFVLVVSYLFMQYNGGKNKAENMMEKAIIL